MFNRIIYVRSVQPGGAFLHCISMARFFFHLHECGNLTQDEEGIELPDLAAARVKAVREAREIMCAEVAEGRLCLACRIEVTGAAGEMLMTLAFRDALTVVV